MLIRDIEIRPLTEDDLGFLVEVRNECRHLLHDDREFTLEEATSWFRLKVSEYYIIRCKGEKCGYFRTSNADLDNETIWIGADLHPDFRGRGIAKMAYPLFLNLMNTMGFYRFVLEVLEFNSIALGLYRKIGFREVERKELSRGVSIRMELEWPQRTT